MSMADVNQFYLDTPTANGIKMYIVNIGRPKKVSNDTLGMKYSSWNPILPGNPKEYFSNQLVMPWLNRQINIIRKPLESSWKVLGYLMLLELYTLLKWILQGQINTDIGKGIVYPYAGIIH